MAEIVEVADRGNVINVGTITLKKNISQEHYTAGCDLLDVIIQGGFSVALNHEKSNKNEEVFDVIG
jgi:hypothetical protein